MALKNIHVNLTAIRDEDRSAYELQRRKWDGKGEEKEMKRRMQKSTYRDRLRRLIDMNTADLMKSDDENYIVPAFFPQ